MRILQENPFFLVGLLVMCILPKATLAVGGLVDDEYVLSILVDTRCTLSDLNSMLASEGSRELPDPITQPEEAASRWKAITEYEWKRILNATYDGSESYPFIYCSRNPFETGQQRLSSLYLKMVNNYPGDVSKFINQSTAKVLFNADSLTCAIVRVPISLAIDVATEDFKGFQDSLPGSTSRTRPDIVMQPLISLFKITAGSIKRFSSVFETNSTWYNQASNVDALIPNINLLFCDGGLTDDMQNDIEEDIANNGGAYLKEALTNKTKDGSMLAFEVVYNQFFAPGTESQQAVDFYYNYRNQTSATNRKQFWEEVFTYVASGVCGDLIAAATFQFDRNTKTLSFRVPKRPADQTLSNSAAFVTKTVTKFCGLAMLAGLSQVDEICSVDVQVQLELQNIQSAWITQSGVRETFPWFDAGLTGAGQVVSVSDTGLDMNNCYFLDATGTVFETTRGSGSVDASRRKVVQYNTFVDNSDYKSGHGTHVCGTIAGNKAIDGKTPSNGMANGVAKDAKIAFFDIGHPDGSLSTPFPPTTLFTEAQKANAYIHSASWGSESNSYGYNARAFDDFVYKNEEFLIVVAAGNSGDGSTFNSVGDPATAKNIISVGATNSDAPDLQNGQLDFNYIAPFSSRGPSEDGRTLPHVMNVGKWVLSANAGGFCDPGSYPQAGSSAEGVLSLQGTSMATPGVSGTAAIIRQYFVEGWYPEGVRNSTNIHIPTAALIKAVLMNGAQPLLGVDNGGFRGTESSSMYDNIQNMGRISLADSLYLPGFTNVKTIVFDRETVQQGETRIFPVTVNTTNGCQNPEVSITLVWTDPPGAQGCKKCLIHDVDLSVVSSKNPGVSYFPNGLNGPDRNNNAERIRMPAENGEILTIKVNGYNLVYGQQRFALVVAGCFGGVSNTLDTEANKSGKSSQGYSIAKIVGGVIGVVVGLLIIFSGGYWWMKSRESREEAAQRGMANLPNMF